MPQATVKRRKCKDCVETLAHILGQCTHTKSRRIERDNEIRDYLAKKLANEGEETQVIEEASIETPSGTLKPDLVLVHQGRVQVIDVSTAKGRNGIVLIQIDISKAFDTIPHEAVDPALQRLGVPTISRSAITNSYRDLKTTINKQGSKIEINLQRGVKQGDPLSPYIFNAILNPLLEQLEELKGYIINDSQTISTLAFADDIILLADNQQKAQQLLYHTEEYLRNLGMQIAPSKCTALSIITTKDSLYLTNPHLYLTGRQNIPSATATDELSYLGGHVAPWSGLQHKQLVGKLQLVLRRLKGAFLKPYQKLNLHTTIFPYFLHATSLSSTPITTIRNMDSLIRTHVKDFLNIPASTPNGLLYCCKRDGGLGIPKLETLAISTTLK
jgi:hypothetical protein